MVFRLGFVECWGVRERLGEARQARRGRDKGRQMTTWLEGIWTEEGWWTETGKENYARWKEWGEGKVGIK